MSAEIARTADLPTDGMITIRPWDRTRRRGWHIERVDYDNDDFATVSATPVNIGTGDVTGDARQVHLRFGLDLIEAMP